MRYGLTVKLAVGLGLLVVAGCQNPVTVTEFWRPISEPNVQMELDKAQMKLDFDLKQCQCGIAPRNIPQPLVVEAQPDIQRLVETGVTVTDKGMTCGHQPEPLINECMRTRGWERTKCSGRLSVAGGATLCAAWAQ